MAANYVSEGKNSASTAQGNISLVVKGNLGVRILQGLFDWMDGDNLLSFKILRRGDQNLQSS